jgi:hypothetical protein
MREGNVKDLPKEASWNREPNPPLLKAKALRQTHIHVETKGHINYAINTIPRNLRCQPKPLALVYVKMAANVTAVVKIAICHPIWCSNPTALRWPLLCLVLARGDKRLTQGRR